MDITKLTDVLINWDKTKFNVHRPAEFDDTYLTEELILFIFDCVGFVTPHKPYLIWAGWSLLRPQIETILKAPSLTEALVVVRIADSGIKSKVTEFYKVAQQIIQEKGITI